MGQRRGRIDADDPRVRAVREHDLEVQHAGPDQIAGVVRRAGDLAERVGARKRGANQWCHDMNS
jgi:hypothetical protein